MIFESEIVSHNKHYVKRFAIFLRCFDNNIEPNVLPFQILVSLLPGGSITGHHSSCQSWNRGCKYLCFEWKGKLRRRNRRGFIGSWRLYSANLFLLFWEQCFLLQYFHHSPPSSRGGAKIGLHIVHISGYIVTFTLKLSLVFVTIIFCGPFPEIVLLPTLPKGKYNLLEFFATNRYQSKGTNKLQKIQQDKYLQIQ